MNTNSKDLTVVVIKPDLNERQLVNEFLTRLERNGLEIIFQGVVKFNLELVKLFYQWDIVLYPKEIWQYLCSQNLRFLVVRGKNALYEVSRIKQEMRQKFCAGNPIHNLIHCSDSPDEFRREFAIILAQQVKMEEKTMSEIKTNNQVEVILFQQKEKEEILFLMLKRNLEKGGFWQPITGNVKPHETFEEAALREMQEETGIMKALEIIDTGYSFDFFDDNRTQHEKVFGISVASGAIVRISKEHTEFRWVNKEDALYRYLKYPGNKAGLSKLCEKLVI